MSNLSKCLSSIASFDLPGYEQEVATSGRASLAANAALVAQIHDLAETTAGIRNNYGAVSDRSLRNAVAVSSLFLQAQEYVLRNDKPRYEAYAGIPLLRHLLGVDSHQALSLTERRIWFIFGVLVRAQLDFEQTSLAGLSRYAKMQFDPEVSRARCELLRQAAELIPSRFGLTSASESLGAVDLATIGADLTGTSATQHLLTFPQTTCHDEVAFIRLIQMTECLFSGTLLFVQRAITAFHVDELPGAVQLLASAVEFASPLIKVVHAVRTMPPSHFLGFREATGNASAVQSQSWQLLDAHVYGILPEKVATLERVPEVQHVLRFANPTFVSLTSAVGTLGTSDREVEFANAATELDHKLRAWRTFHTKQLAGKKDPSYLPPEAMGTGGTEGYGYLAAHKPPRPTPGAARNPDSSRGAMGGT